MKPTEITVGVEYNPPFILPCISNLTNPIEPSPHVCPEPGLYVNAFREFATALESVNVALNFVNYKRLSTFTPLAAEILNGSIDMGFSAFTDVPERRKLVAMSNPVRFYQRSFLFNSAVKRRTAGFVHFRVLASFGRANFLAAFFVLLAFWFTLSVLRSRSWRAIPRELLVSFSTVFTFGVIANAKTVLAFERSKPLIFAISLALFFLESIYSSIVTEKMVLRNELPFRTLRGLAESIDRGDFRLVFKDRGVSTLVQARTPLSEDFRLLNQSLEKYPAIIIPDLQGCVDAVMTNPAFVIVGYNEDNDAIATQSCRLSSVDDESSPLAWASFAMAPGKRRERELVDNALVYFQATFEQEKRRGVRRVCPEDEAAGSKALELRNVPTAWTILLSGLCSSGLGFGVELLTNRYRK